VIIWELKKYSKISHQLTGFLFLQKGLSRVRGSPFCFFLNCFFEKNALLYTERSVHISFFLKKITSLHRVVYAHFFQKNYAVHIKFLQILFFIKI
jgi:hypothetical protein